MTDGADGKRSSMSSVGPMRAARGELQMPEVLRWYLAHERAILGTLVVMLFLIGWEGLERGWWADLLRPLLGASAERLRLKPIFISSPTLIAAAAFRMFFVTGEIWRDLAWSGVGYVLGLGLAIAVGIPLGLAAGWHRRFSYAVEPLLSALNATPQVAFLPLIVVWVGTGLGERVLIIFLLAVLPLAINAHAAVRTIDPRLVKVASSLGAGDWRLFRTIILPSSVPFLLAGLRLAIGRGMIGVVVGEIYGSAAGVGAMINQAGARFQTDKVFVGVLTIVAVGVILVEIVQRIERRVDVWRAPTGLRQPHDDRQAGSAGHPAGICPAPHQYPARGARWRRPEDHGRRIRVDRGAIRLRQDHVPLGGRRFDRRERGPHPGRRPGGDEAGAGPRSRVPGCLAAAVADGAQQCPLRTGVRQRRRARGQGARIAFHRDGRPFRLRASLSLRAVGRHAAAREPCARAGHGSEDLADGRAVRIARRANSRGDAGGAAADLGEGEKDGAVRDPSNRRSHLSIGPCRGLCRPAG